MSEESGKEIKIGDRMADGTVYAGTSPDTGKPMYATPADSSRIRLYLGFQADDSLSYNFNEAQKYAAKLDAHGHQDWRVPTRGELNVLFQNRAAIGGFDVSGSIPAGWYWSSTKDFLYSGWDQRFSDGNQVIHFKFSDSSLRCVR